MASIAEVAIKRITFKGTILGGAFECQKCPSGTVAPERSFHCLPCTPGSEQDKDQASCQPCKEGYFNPEDRGWCKLCPAFTSSRRHEEDPTYYAGGAGGKVSEERADVTASTHCVLDSELHVLQTGQIYKPGHFSARRLCAEDKFLQNSNICAGQNIIGPVSDVQHMSHDEDDRWEDDLLDDDEDDFFFDEEDDFDEEDWEDFEDWIASDDDGWVPDDEAWDSLERDEKEFLKQALEDKRKQEGQTRRLRRVLKEESYKKHYEEKGLNYGLDQDDASSLPRENLFFFTDQDYFRSSRYEFMSKKNPGKGFVFGLFDPKPLADSDKAVSDLEGNTYLSSYSSKGAKNLDPISHLNKINNYRVLKNLGS